MTDSSAKRLTGRSLCTEWESVAMTPCPTFIHQYVKFLEYNRLLLHPSPFLIRICYCNGKCCAALPYITKCEIFEKSVEIIFGEVELNT